MNLWIVGKVTSHEAGAWEFIGAFDAEAPAVAACRTRDYFIGGPVALNEALPDETVEWPSARYPVAEADAVAQLERQGE